MECYGISLTQLKAFAQSFSAPDIYFDWNNACAIAGYYSFKEVTMCCAERVKSFVLVGDAVWMEPGILVRLRRMILRVLPWSSVGSRSRTLKPNLFRMIGLEALKLGT